MSSIFSNNCFLNNVINIVNNWLDNSCAAGAIFLKVLRLENKISLQKSLFGAYP